MFYNSLSSNGDIILKFLREKFVILIKSFFLSPNPPKNCNFSIYDNLEITKEGLLEENMNILNSSTLDLDGKFENFVKNSSNSNSNYNPASIHLVDCKLTLCQMTVLNFRHLLYKWTYIF